MSEHQPDSDEVLLRRSNVHPEARHTYSALPRSSPSSQRFVSASCMGSG